MISTFSIAPSGTPESISFSNVNLTSITVQWTELPCSDRNGEITGYTVEHNSMVFTVSDPSNRRLVVGGLLPRTSYTFSVRAHGRWEYGSDSVGSNTPIYSNKGFSSILLNRRSSALGPVGVYRCVIPDAGNILRSLTITVNGELEVFAEHEVTSNNGLSVFIPSQYPDNLLLATI